MALERSRRRIAVLRKGLTALAGIYRRERDLRGTAGQAWFVLTRQGLVGVHDWLVSSLPAVPVAEAAPPVPEPPPPVPPPVPSAPDAGELYRAWLKRYDPLREPGLAAARRHLATLDLPDVLILAAVTPGNLHAVARMAESWAQSIHRRWTAVLVASRALPEADRERLATLVADPRVSVATTPEQVEAARAGAAFTLVSVGATLLNGLSAYMFLEAAVRTGADIVYSDHDRIDGAGRRVDPTFKPQFSPEYLARCNYIGDCLLLSGAAAFPRADTGALAEALLGADGPGFDAAVARLARGRTVEHLPFPLFHALDPQPHPRHDLPAIPDSGPRAAIVIPTRDGVRHLRACIDSITGRTSYDMARVRIVVVDNNSVEAETLGYLDTLAARPDVSVVRFPGAFNFAEINNVGARASGLEGGDVLVFLNDDTTVHDPAWLSKLVAYARQPGVGMVGAKLLYPDGTVQHGGCVAGSSRGTVQHLLSHRLAADVAAIDHTREMTTMTGACMAVRRDVFDRVGGFDPILRVTWNDVKACLECLAAGLRNIYVADPLLVHYESKTRAKDDTREHYVRYFSEADYTRRRFRRYFQDDPSYNPCLSLENAGDLAEPPRVRLPWFRTPGEAPRILLLSAVYRRGFGVPLVIQQHAIKLRQLGYEVTVGGPPGEDEFAFPGCERAPLGSVREAAEYAFTRGVALVVCHTPPFFELPILIGEHIPVLSYDYGEPGAEFFPEPVRSYLLEVGYQKREAAALTTAVATISQAVKDETLNRDACVLGLANSHLPAWTEAFRPDRERLRLERGWADAFVVLTVCRFHVNERAYKGLTKIAAIQREMPYLYPAQSEKLVWLLVGAGTAEDVAEVEALGFTVLPNVSDAVLADMYKAADSYMGMSRWEGYNLGVSQALAMGLPTLGSDIPAHREFPIECTDSVLGACAWLAREVEARAASGPGRRATVYEWERSTAAFAAVVEGMLEQSAVQVPRRGASGAVWEDMAA